MPYYNVRIVVVCSCKACTAAISSGIHKRF